MLSGGATAAISVSIGPRVILCTRALIIRCHMTIAREDSSSVIEGCDGDLIADDPSRLAGKPHRQLLVKKLLGHRHVTTTQIYDKRRRSAREGASHDVPI